MTAAARRWGTGFEISSTIVLPYATFPQGHSHLALFVPASVVGPACKPTMAGYLSQLLTVLAGPPRNPAEVDWARIRQAERAMASGRLQEAERITRDVLSAHTRHALVTALLAGVVEKQGRSRAASRAHGASGEASPVPDASFKMSSARATRMA